MSEVDQEALRVAAEVAEEAESPQHDPKTVTLSNGIVLRLKPVPPFLLRQAVTKLTEPKLPKADIGKGREEDNPDDPAYLAAMMQFNACVIEAVTNVAFVMGTEIETLPPGTCGPEGKDWLEALDVLGVEVDERPRGRYLAWLRYYAVTSQGDVLRILTASRTNLGLTEGEVGLAANSFPSRAARRKNNGPSAADAGHGDNLRSTPTRRRSRSGGKRSS